MDQGKLEVVKQEMATVNIDILGISEIKWRGMGEFNSDDRDAYYCGYEAQLASIRQMSGQVSRDSAGECQADERAGVAGLKNVNVHS